MNKYIGLSIMAVALVLSSCSKFDDFLDTTPDNRATLDSEEKVDKMLVSAYQETTPILFMETMSDNVDDYGENNPNTDRFLDQVFHWEDVTETDNDDPNHFWETSYTAIINANLALEAAEKLPETRNSKAACAEALLVRAYNHFMLANVFCKNYNSATSSVDLGIPYLDAVEDKLDAHHERGTVAEVYEKIDKDLQEALPYVGSEYMSVPKYHFNPKAAYAFACRFYLFYEKWDKAIEYANLCLGSEASSQLRDWKTMSTLTSEFEVISNHYIDASLNCNLLLVTSYSSVALNFGPYYEGKRYAHGNYLAANETCLASNIFGSDASVYYSRPRSYSATNLECVIFWKLPRLVEITDPVAQVGYLRCVYPALTTDEVILNRAEAYIMTGQYEKAVADLNTWKSNITKNSTTLTVDDIVNFYNSVNYSYDKKVFDDKGELTGIEFDGTVSTIKKHLHPAFTIDKEGSTQEALLQCVLGFRRIETLQTGLRWFDIKRYGIEIVRRVIAADGKPGKVVDVLKTDDPRRAIQIPPRVRDAGIEANPR